MTILEAYYEAPGRGRLSSEMEWSPFRHDDVLQECMAVDFRCNVVDSILGIIIDRRTGLAEEGGNTGLMVLEGVTRLHWTGSSPAFGEPYSRSIMSHVMGADGDRFTLRFFLQKADLEVDFVRGIYYEGEVPGLALAQPDLTEFRSPYPENSFQRWSSEFFVVESASIAFGQLASRDSER